MFFSPSLPLLRIFPLFLQAMQFTKHSDNLIRTSARTITLQIFHLFSSTKNNDALDQVALKESKADFSKEEKHALEELNKAFLDLVLSLPCV